MFCKSTFTNSPPRFIYINLRASLPKNKISKKQKIPAKHQEAKPYVWQGFF